MLALQPKCLVQSSPWILQITWMMTWFSKSLTRAQLWGQMRSNIQISLRVGVPGRADKGNTLCHSALWEHLGSVIACEDSWFNESIVSQRPGFTDIREEGELCPHMGCLGDTVKDISNDFFFPQNFILPFFWHMTQLAGYQFPNQGLNPNHGSESAKS